MEAQGDDPKTIGEKASSAIAVAYFIFCGTIAGVYLVGKYVKIILKAVWRCAVRCWNILPCVCVYNCLKKICGCFLCIFRICSKKEEEETEEQRAEREKQEYLKELQEMGIDCFSNDILADLKVGPLQDYYRKALKEWQEFVENE